jgi:mono/diheme cytochrome c family protein
MPRRRSIAIRRLVVLTATATAALGAAVAALVAAAVVRGGLYDVAASTPHTQWVYSLMETTFEQSVRRRARAIDVPALDSPALVQRGATCFAQHCMACHGAPGVAPTAAGLGMQPSPGPLVDSATLWRARELYWITRHGIRMTGMPAWGHRLADEDLWALTAFLGRLPEWSPAQWRREQERMRGLPCVASR